MGIVEKLTFGLGAKLEGNVLDTKKEDKKVSKKSSKTILPKIQHQLVFGFEKIKEILKLLKTNLACGGSIKGETIEIQGDLKDKIRVILVDNGWKFKN